MIPKNIRVIININNFFNWLIILSNFFKKNFLKLVSLKIIFWIIYKLILIIIYYLNLNMFQWLTFYWGVLLNHRIIKIKALEILDSRGNPTIRTRVFLENGIVGCASVPSGASTGINEAIELRDGDKNRFNGKGVLKAVEIINKNIGPELIGMDPMDQEKIDKIMINLDGSENKKNLGANSILSISLANAVAASNSINIPLYKYLGGIKSKRLPIPMFNIINGGEHADNSVDFQEFMIMPIGAENFKESLRFASETFQSLKKILLKLKYSTGVGDEGGFSPNLKNNEEACELVLEAINKAGFKVAEDIFLAIDAASSSFYENGNYNFKKSDGSKKKSTEMVDFFCNLCEKYPIFSIEDPMDENDWDGFINLTNKIGSKVQIVGDDLFVTNKKYVDKGIKNKAANSVLIKLNQIGTLSETIETIEICKKAGWKYIISHRSGETEDTFLADFSVGMGGGQIKTGSTSRSERISKYNRLLEIEDELEKSYFFI